MPHGRKAVPHNRIAAVMEHTTKYVIEGRARLARDAGVSKSAVSRLVRRECVPSTTLMLAVTRALEKQLGRPLDPRELISPNGEYPTANVCELCGCPGCLPERAYNEDGSLKPGWEGVEPGTWSLRKELS